MNGKRRASPAANTGRSAPTGTLGHARRRAGDGSTCAAVAFPSSLYSSMNSATVSASRMNMRLPERTGVA
jgi:hypothetical protein